MGRNRTTVLQVIALSAVLVATASCGPGAEPEEWYRNCGELESGVDIDILPSVWVMPTLGRVHYRADVSGSEELVTWWVNGIEGGDAEVGRISDSGRYRAPSHTTSVWVTAKVGAKPGECASSLVLVLPEMGLPSRRYHRFMPRVIAPDRTEPVTLEVSVNGYADSVSVRRYNGLNTVLQAVGAPSGFPLYRGELAAAHVLHAYSTGAVLQPAGGLRFTRDANYVGSMLNMKIPVRTAVMPSVPAVSDATSQTSAHVFNVSGGPAWLDGTAPPWALEELYARHPDVFDWVATISQVQRRANRGHTLVRNDVVGLGIAPIDRTAELGIPATATQLQGLISYPIETMFDLAERGSVHELGHRWMVGEVGAFSSMGHWAMSDLAYGLMGYALPGGAGGEMPWTLRAEQASGQVFAIWAGSAAHFNDFELYLMGVLQPPASRVHFTVDSPVLPAPYESGPIVGTPVFRTVAEIIAELSPRAPAVGAAPTSFRLATVVLSMPGELLNDDELAWFDYMAARGESATEVAVLPGMNNPWGRTTFVPFGPATQGRATLSTTIVSSP